MEAKLTCYLLTPQRGPTQVRLDVHSPVAWCVLEGADNIFISLIQEGGGAASDDKRVFFHECNTLKHREQTLED